MGRRRKTPEEKAAEKRAANLSGPYKVGKAMTGLRDMDVAELAGISAPTLRAHCQNPGKFRVETLDIIGTALGWTNDDYLAVVHPQGIGK